jgi:4-alpha-glucanotransferase
VADYAACGEAQQLVGSTPFHDEVRRLRSLEKVDYAGVAALKLPVLELLFSHFQGLELGSDSARAAEFRQFVKSGGEALRLHALYDALHEHLRPEGEELHGWPEWPAAYRDPHASAVQEFCREKANRIGFYQYLQWCASQQIMAVQEQAIAAGMAIGVYLDLAVGTSPGGSETWSNQQLFCFAANAGAPPDELATQGQDWGFPPFQPAALRDHAYDLFARNLRANMVCAGAVRFDHCVSLLRLWWIPHGNGAREGAYVHYRIDELTAVLALESHREQCLVIGEDLGTVPEALPHIMERNAIYCYRVLYFEMEYDQLVSPEDYPSHALATINTHDVAPLASWWDASDIELRVSLQVLNDAEVIQQLRDRRSREKQLVLNALHHYGYMSQFRRVEEVPELTREVNEGLHCYLAGSRAAVMISQLEDWMNMHSPVNVPGTFREYDNWQRKLENELEDFFCQPDNRAMLKRIIELRARVDH